MSSKEKDLLKSTILPKGEKIGNAHLTQTKVMKYSVPKMAVSLSDTTDLLGPGGANISQSFGSGNMSPIKKRSDKSTKILIENHHDEKKSKIMEKLKSSPFLPSSSSMGDLRSKTKTGHKNVETDWALRQSVSAVMKGQSSSNANKIYIKSQTTETKVQNENQGPIDWLSEGLRSKYRSESEREATWAAYVHAAAFSETTAYSEDHDVVPVALIERHPLVAMYESMIHNENHLSQQRTAARMQMKRFVMDVHEIWLTNLQHLREHQPNQLFQITGQHATGKQSKSRNGSRSNSARKRSGSESDGENSLEDDLRGNGIQDRRDVKAIENLSSQIQSVSFERSMKNTFYTTRMPEPSARLDYVARAGPPNIAHVDMAMLRCPIFQSLLHVANDTITTSPSNIPVVFSIDRLCPKQNSNVDRPTSASHKNILKGLTSTMWRILIIRKNEDLIIRSYTIPEPEVHQYITNLSENLERVRLLQSSDSNSNTNSTINNNVSNRNRVIFDSRTMNIPWGTAMDLQAHTVVTVVYIEESSLHSLSKTTHVDNRFQIHIAVTLQTHFEGMPPINLVLDPVEFCVLLGLHNIPSLSISLYEWLMNVSNNSKSGNGDNEISDLEEESDVDDVRNRNDEGESTSAHNGNEVDIWERFRSQLFVEEGDEDVHGDPMPARIALRAHHEEPVGMVFSINGDSPRVKSPTSRKGETVLTPPLSTSLAMSYAIYLASILEIGDDLSITLACGGGGVNRSRDDTPANGDGRGSSSGSPSKTDQLLTHLHSQIKELKLPFKELPKADHFAFESISDNTGSLSLRVAGGISMLKQVPGSCPIGSMGLWIKYTQDKERTQACASFFRNPQLSSTDSVLVNLTLALDTPILCPATISWDCDHIYPPKTPHHPADGFVITYTPFPKTLLNTPVKSLLDNVFTPMVHIFNTSPTEGVDFVTLLPFQNTTAKPPKGFTRYLPDRDSRGFRNNVFEKLLDVDPVLPTVVFGVTKMGAVPNNVAVHTRSIWHSCTAITDAINRIRGSKDYFYVLFNDVSHGPNDPSTFVLRFQNYGNKDLFEALVVSSAFTKFEKLYETISEERQKFNREAALDAKIENSEVFLRTKLKRFEMEMRKQTQRGIEKKMRKATKSERGWTQRMLYSIQTEVQGEWEQRLDQRVGMCFFHRLYAGSDESFVNTCQWEVPSSWSGDPLNASNIELAIQDGENKVSEKLGIGEGAFTQPAEIWLPHENVGSFHRDTDKTPGVMPMPYKRIRSADRERLAGLSSTNLSKASNSKTKDKLGENSAAKSGNSQMQAIAEDILLNDDLIYALARRLGIDVSNIAPVHELRSVFTVEDSITSSQLNIGPLDAPREPSIDPSMDAEDPKFDSDDDIWSDDEKVVGDFDAADVGTFLPNSHQENSQFKKQSMELLGSAGLSQEDADKTKKNLANDTQVVGGNFIPDLHMASNSKMNVGGKQDGNKTVLQWRKLPRPEIASSFFKKCTLTKTLGPDSNSVSSKPNNPVFLVPLSPVDACQYNPMKFSVDIESIFIPNARQDMERVIATIERNILREEELGKNLPTDELLLFGKPSEMTSVDNFVAKQYLADKDMNRDATQEAVEKAIQAAKTSNLAEMEDALEEEIKVDTIDEFGNTLLLLAAQQGSKRMVKYLLRRGAFLNAQNSTGNTALHYCYTYGHTELADYLKAKGADDSVLNAQRLTCYEGLSIDNV